MAQGAVGGEEARIGAEEEVRARVGVQKQCLLLKPVWLIIAVAMQM